MKLDITKVTVRTTNKEGQPYINKFGKPFVVVGIQTTQYGQQWISGFADSAPAWEGTQQELEIKKEMYNGKEQLKFSIPKKEAQDNAETKRLLNDVLFRLGALNVKINDIHSVLFLKKPAASVGLAPTAPVAPIASNTTSDGAPMPFPDEPAAQEINADEIPW